MKKKYFFFDIDGTLTDSSRNITPSARDTVLKLQQNGHFVAVATGRAHYRTVDLTEGVGIRNMVCNGGACIAINDEIVLNTPLDRDRCIDIIAHAEAEGIGWLVTLDDTDSCYLPDYKFLEQGGRRNEATTYKIVPGLDYRNLTDIGKVYLAVHADQEHLYPWIHQLPYLRFNPRHIVFEQDQKKDGIIHMMNLLNAPLEDIVVFGDGKNDVTMFDDRWMTIAMGNGSEELKKKAKYVTTANVDDGIRNACLHFGWITD